MWGIVYVIGMILLIFLFFAIAESSRKSTLENYLPIMKEVDEKWRVVLKGLGNMTKKCSRCGESTFQIWNIYTNDSIEIRCKSCKKKRNIDRQLLILIKEENDIEISLTSLANRTVNRINTFQNKDAGWNNYTQYVDNFCFDFSYRAGKWWRSMTFRPQIPREPQNTDTSRYIKKEVKKKVWIRDEGKCVECGSTENLEFDHIIPHSKGGSNRTKNIQILCKSCNLKKSARIDG